MALVVSFFYRSIFSGMRILRMVFGVSWRLFLELVILRWRSNAAGGFMLYGGYFLRASMHCAM